MNFIKSNTLSMRAFPGALLVVFIALAGCGKKDATPAAAAATTAAKAAPEGSQPLALSAEESRAANLQVATVAPPPKPRNTKASATPESW